MALRLPLLPRWLRWCGVLVVAGVIVYASLITAPPETIIDRRPDLIPLDKWRHFLAYGAFGCTLAYATADWHDGLRRLALGVLLVTVCFGLAMEIGQAFTARHFSLWDAYANALGALLVLPFYAIRSRLTFVPIGAWVGSRDNTRTR